MQLEFLHFIRVDYSYFFVLDSLSVCDDCDGDDYVICFEFLKKYER
jgi:hypothetical protein